MRITDFDDAYANRDHIEGAEDYIARWVSDSAAFREASEKQSEIDLAYGPGERNRFDLFRPESGEATGLVVFVHGGYWRLFDKSYWSAFAAGVLAAGWAVAIPSYTLMPGTTFATIAAEINAAIEAAAGRVPGPLRLVGHSAGGHLVTRMICRDTRLAGDVLSRIELTLSISGVHDLRPLIETEMNKVFDLDMRTARAESPALLAPRMGARVTAWVGGDERPEFIRQSDLIANIWLGLGADTTSVVEPGKHHFDVIDGLRDPESSLMRTLLS